MCSILSAQRGIEETSKTRHGPFSESQVKDQVHGGQKSGERKKAGHEKHLTEEYQNPDVGANACNTTLQELEAGEIPGVQGQPEIHSHGL